MGESTTFAKKAIGGFCGLNGGGSGGGTVGICGGPPGGLNGGRAKKADERSKGSD